MWIEKQNKMNNLFSSLSLHKVEFLQIFRCVFLSGLLQHRSAAWAVFTIPQSSFCHTSWIGSRCGDWAVQATTLEYSSSYFILLYYYVRAHLTNVKKGIVAKRSSFTLTERIISKSSSFYFQCLGVSKHFLARVCLCITVSGRFIIIFHHTIVNLYYTLLLLLLLILYFYMCVSVSQHQGMFSVTKWSTQGRSHICVIYVVEVTDSSPHENKS